MEQVTYCGALTLVPTYECFNRCGYCNFRREPGQGSWLSIEEVEDVLSRLSGTGTREILILSGELHPKSQQRKRLMQHSLIFRRLKQGKFVRSFESDRRGRYPTFPSSISILLGQLMEKLGFRN